MSRCVALTAAAWFALASLPGADGNARPNWPQFRGPSGSGLAAAGEKPPVEFGPGKKMLWKTALPAGHGSPSIWGDRIFLTAFVKETKTLETIAADRRTGKILWRRPAPAQGIEEVHEVSSPATATVAVDGERAYAYFGSCGLLAYDFEGRLVWSVPMPVAKAGFGAGTSPIVAGEMVLLIRDDAKDRYLLAADRRTGKTVWQQPRDVGEALLNTTHSTPAVWNQDVIIHQAREIVGFDLRTGARRWWLSAVTQGNGTPVVGPDAVYAGAWSPSGEPDLIVPLPEFDAIVSKYDKDGDGAFSESEFPRALPTIRRLESEGISGATITLGTFAKTFVRADTSKDGKIDKAEWSAMVRGMSQRITEHGMIAVKPGGEGEIGAGAVLWKEPRGVPEIPAPLVTGGRLYMVTNGGIVSTMDAKTGKLLFRGRLGAGGPYYSSPVAAAGKVYFSSGEGVVTVIQEGDRLEVAARNDLGEPLYATPALVDSKIYIRTTAHLYAFGE